MTQTAFDYHVLDSQGNFTPEAAAVLRMNVIASWPDENTLPTDAQIAVVMERVRVNLIEGNLAMMAALGTAAVRQDGKRLSYQLRPPEQVAALRAAAAQDMPHK